MKKIAFKKTTFISCALLGLTLLCRSAHAQDIPANEVPNFHMSGDVSLLTNYVDKGLTQTHKDPSLQGAFSFNFGPQFKMGLWGSNVNFQSTEHFLLKINAELKINISTTTDIKIGYLNNRYYSGGTRSGATTYALITSYGYRVRYESNTNWEGTDAKSSYYSFGKTIDLDPSWKWDNEVGYTMLDVANYDNYFDARTAIIYKGSSNVNYQLAATATSAPTQFNGQGDVFIYAGAETTF